MSRAALVVAACVAALAAGCDGGDAHSENNTPPPPTGAAVHDESDVRVHLGLGKNDRVVTPEGVECEVAVILTTKNQVDLYVGAGDVVATNPDGTAGAKVSGAEQATCFDFFTMRLTTFPDGDPAPLSEPTSTADAQASPSEAGSSPSPLGTAKLTYFDVTINDHRAGRRSWGVEVSVCYMRPHPGANADGTTRVSTDPWSMIVQPEQGDARAIPVSQLRVSSVWSPTYGEGLLRVGQCREGWIAVDHPDLPGSFSGVKYAPSDFPGDATTWRW